jgi:hypothetical protein
MEADSEKLSFIASPRSAITFARSLAIMRPKIEKVDGSNA